jgi:Domain of unknown function (DUF4112)
MNPSDPDGLPEESSMSAHSTISHPERPVVEPELIDPVHEGRLKRIDLIATLMDDAFMIPGTNRRIGWDTLIGLVPGVGDAAAATISAWLVYEARQLGLPRRKIARMLANIGLDTVVGSIPLAGDVFDWAFKANRKNAQIVRDHFRRGTR